MSRPVNRRRNLLRDAAPEIDVQTVPRPQNIVRTGGKVHRKNIQVARTVKKNVSTEPFKRCPRTGNLAIEVLSRRQVGVRIGAVSGGGLVLIHGRSFVGRGALDASTGLGCLGSCDLFGFLGWRGYACPREENQRGEEGSKVR